MSFCSFTKSSRNVIYYYKIQILFTDRSLLQIKTSVNLTQVTKLDRDPSSGTALQEISFWLNLERALLRIQEKRESQDIVLTLEILKHGKRFHATVSFDTDTGKFVL